jgi:hypothetical protein
MKSSVGMPFQAYNHTPHDPTKKKIEKKFRLCFAITILRKFKPFKEPFVTYQAFMV